MKIARYIILLGVLWVSCAPVQIKPSITFDNELLFSRQWNVAVLDLNYEYEGEGQFGLGQIASGGRNGGQVMAGLLAAELSKIHNFTLVERGQIKKVLAEHALQQSGMMDTQTMSNLGRLVGADAVVTGDLIDYVLWTNPTGYGSTVSLSIRMIEVSSGKVIMSSTISRARAAMDILANAQLTTAELVEGIRSAARGA